MASKKQTSTKEFPKELTTPIYIEKIELKTSLLSAGSEDKYLQKLDMMRNTQNGRILIEITEKMMMLFDCFGVDHRKPDAYRDLCMEMAKEFLLGFTVKYRAQPGPKNKWGPLVLYRLYYEVFTYTVKGKSALHACRQLVKKEPWASMLKSSTPEIAMTSLNKQYQKALVSPLVSSMKKVFEVAPNDPAAHESAKTLYDLACSGALKVQ